MSAPTFKGFGPLKTAADLLAKLRYDFDRLEREPDNAYAAFDFFSTASHMPEWVYPKRELRAVERKKALHRICTRLANGGKHFEDTGVRLHNVVGGFQRGAFKSNAFQVRGLFVTRNGACVGAIDLAREILQYWDTHPETCGGRRVK